MKTEKPPSATAERCMCRVHIPGLLGCVVCMMLRHHEGEHVALFVTTWPIRVSWPQKTKRGTPPSAPGGAA